MDGNAPPPESDTWKSYDSIYATIKSHEGRTETWPRGGDQPVTPNCDEIILKSPQDQALPKYIIYFGKPQDIISEAISATQMVYCITDNYSSTLPMRSFLSSTTSPLYDGVKFRIMLQNNSGLYLLLTPVPSSPF